VFSTIIPYFFLFDFSKDAFQRIWMFYEKIICPKNKWACKTAKKPNILLVTYKRMLYGSKHLIENHTSQWQAPALAQIIHSGFFYCRLGWEIWQTCLLAHVVQVCGFWSTHLDSNFISTVNNLRSCMAVVPKLWYDGLQGGTRDPSVLLRQKKHFVFTSRVLLINSCIFVYFPY